MTRKILEAMSRWMEAKAELMKCYKECDSSPGYFCQRYADKEEEARIGVGNALDEAIDARIAFALEKAKP